MFTSGFAFYSLVCECFHFCFVNFLHWVLLATQDDDILSDFRGLTEKTEEMKGEEG